MRHNSTGKQNKSCVIDVTYMYQTCYNYVMYRCLARPMVIFQRKVMCCNIFNVIIAV